MGYVESLARESMHAIMFVQGKREDNTLFHAYIAVPFNQLNQFAQAQQSGIMDIDRFCQVLVEGEGLHPSAETRRFMEREYHFNHDEYVVLKEEV